MTFCFVVIILLSLSWQLLFISDSDLKFCLFFFSYLSVISRTLYSVLLSESSPSFCSTDSPVFSFSVAAATYRIKLRMSTARLIFRILHSGVGDASKIAPSMGDPVSYLIHGSLGTPESIAKTVFAELKVVTNRQTDTHTHADHGTSVTIGRILCYMA